ncbi:MAG: hypothetical protein NZ561_08985 [Phycisphaerae bacterium]|nr:hypothetical protein [Phycisphaerae bacterium]MDW8263005.1 hypothetical protein [Phycisphaerales bacterium]
MHIGRRLLLCFGLVTLPWLSAGCILVGAAAATMPPPTIEAQYSNLAGQTVAVMVWADRDIRVDWPSLQLDLATAIQNRLMQHTAKGKALAGARFVYSPQSMDDYQQDHPEAEFAPIESTAVRLGVSRLIYVEVEDFSTRTDVAGEMFLGRISATLKVVEVDGGRGSVAFEQRDLTCTFPPRAPKEGTLRGSDALMYRGVLQVLAERIQNQFVPHEMG